ncbi:lipopolysaccharide biosynthesis protein [uncultured Stenotrophomonas sp.]|uniref:lipopolysaccharide biosynthesis protein n=1 Tax=uncultured Stenotrophomonas sp. TaxID=165438 RepID=UPI0025E96480|nr:hypothetical protein [uncultured Stenotrophomonas sp.]
MSGSKRIVRNTIFLYIRMLVVMGTSLYTVRVVLHALGVDDFGILGIAGSLIALLSFLNGAMSQAAQRFLSVDIGRGDSIALGRTFNATLATHAAIAAGVVIVAETAGLWFLTTHINIPDERISAAAFVYHCSVASAAILILQTPFNALVVAREKMWFFSAISILEAALKLIVAWLVSHISGDRLMAYGALLLGSAAAIFLSHAVFCRLRFEEARLSPHRDLATYRALTGFISWSFVGNLASVSRNQGVNVLLNIFFGPIANAAHAVMTQSQTAATAFANSFQMALNPQIYQTYARSELERMQELVRVGSKLNFLLLLLATAPVLHSTQYLLDVWLGTPPPMTATFVQWMLVTLLIDSISQPLITAAMATGVIKKYQILVGGTIIMTIPLSFVAFSVTSDPKSFLYISAAISIVTLGMRVALLRSMINFDSLQFVKNTLIPIALASIAPIVFSAAWSACFGEVETMQSMLCSAALIASSTLFAAVFFGLTSPERSFVLQTIRNRIPR